MLRLTAAASALAVALVVRHKQKQRQSMPSLRPHAAMHAPGQPLLTAQRADRRPRRHVHTRTVVPTTKPTTKPTDVISLLLWLLLAACAVLTAHQAHQGL